MNIESKKRLLLLVLLLVATGCKTKINTNNVDATKNTIAQRIKAPLDYQRVTYPKDSYEYFVQNLQVKEDGSKVYLYDGKVKNNQSNHIAIIDYDIGKQDLQQCADAVMRIRAEYLYKTKQYKQLKFHLTNGFLFEYTKYQAGYRLQVAGNKTWLEKTATSNNSYKSFRSYLDTIFTYAGTLSLKAESQPQTLNAIKPGDFFVDDDHAIIVVDVIKNTKTHKKAFLVAQSYMPAQSIHILVNDNSNESPWYFTKDFKYPLVTPEWTFKENTLMQH